MGKAVFAGSARAGSSGGAGWARIPEAAEQLRVASTLSFTAAGRIRHDFRDLHLVHDWLTFDAKAG